MTASGRWRRAAGAENELRAVRTIPGFRRIARNCLRAFSVAIAVSCFDASRAPDPIEIGRPAPTYRAVAMNGDSVSLAALRGKPVLLNVWATWCHPCRDEIPELQRLYERYRGRGLELVGVSVDAAGQNEAIETFARRYGMTYPIWRDPHEIVSAAFLVVGVPATFLIDRAGIVRWKKTGPIGPADTALAAAIEQALNSAS